ncbi:MAG: hypothetical protein GY804_01105 [Alphaproteobacteria bacterium]|nr:hypothetical protein [Alphaproteobacteria bacterium]
MGLGQIRIADEIQDLSELTKHINVNGTDYLTTETYQMTQKDRFVIVDADSTYTHNIMLPPVGESAGKIFTIRVPDSGGDVTIVAYGDGSSLDDAEDWTDLVCGSDADYAVLYSDGFKWYILDSDVD